MIILLTNASILENYISFIVAGHADGQAWLSASRESQDTFERI